MWDLPRPGLEPMSPALAGRFSTTAPPGKPRAVIFMYRHRDGNGGRISWLCGTLILRPTEPPQNTRDPNAQDKTSSSTGFLISFFSSSNRLSSSLPFKDGFNPRFYILLFMEVTESAGMCPKKKKRYSNGKQGKEIDLNRHLMDKWNISHWSGKLCTR